MTASVFPSPAKRAETDIAAIVVAAGRGTRMAHAGAPMAAKQYRLLADRSVLARTLGAMLASPLITRLIVVIGAEDMVQYEAVLAEIVPGLRNRLLPPVIGGTTRQASVRAGLDALASAPPELVLVHDAARPFVTPELIERVVAATRDHGAAIPGVPVTDTIKQVDAQDCVVATPDRARLRAVQTPQGFAYPLLVAAHAGDQPGETATDDAALVEALGMPVVVVMGDSMNIKLTTQADFDAAEQRLSPALITRIGQGYDVHAFGPGNQVWLGGVRIAHDNGVIAHSDGDVILHALTDAVLGALADGDIGTHFPPSEPQWRGASSDQFLSYACERVRARGGVIDHLDSTLISESPRIGPHREAIVARIAQIAGLKASAVSIKATTSEKLGFTGRREGLAAMAIATIRLPAS